MFSVGDLVYSFQEEDYHIVQILQINSEDLLVKDHWEISVLDLTEAEIRSWVKRIGFESLLDYQLLKHVELTEKDLQELDRFLEIEKGLNHRRQRTASMAALVEDAIQSKEFLRALDLLTEWAMLEKYRPEIYLLREECLRQLGRDTEAAYERHVYNTLTGK